MTEWQQGIIYLKKDAEKQSFIDKAANLAYQAHDGVYRASGEPFVLHPLAVATILREQGLSDVTVAAGLLHDVLEDTEITAEHMESLVGKEVTHIVQGVTKIQQLGHRGSKTRAKSETYRKLVLAAADDARILCVKLADRLHNMRTLGHLSDNRQQAIALETLHVYAPLAARLGMNNIHGELLDRSVMVLQAEEWREASRIREQVERAGQAALDSMKDSLADILEKQNITATISSRSKSTASIVKKMSKAGYDIDDLLGLRIVVEDEDEGLLYRTLGLLHKLYRPVPGGFDDYISSPKNTLYQSLHSTVLVEGSRVEVQIRSQHMHVAAEHGVAAHWLYKERLQDGGPPAIKAMIISTAASQSSIPNLDQAFEALKADWFHDEIVVFTPQGDAKILPAGSCAIDFAYTIHSDVGDCCVGARANGKIIPITRQLRHGERIEIVTSPDGHPRLHWLESVRSSRARTAIRHWQEGQAGRDVDAMNALLRAALRALRTRPLSDIELEEAAVESGWESLAALHAAIRKESHTATRWAESWVRKHDHSSKEAQTTVQAAGREWVSCGELGVELGSHTDIPSRFAGCCHPEPPQVIMGYVSLAGGVTLHRQECRNLSSLSRDSAARLLPASWLQSRTSSYTIQLHISCRDRPRLLRGIADCVYDIGAEVVQLQLSSNGKLVRGVMVCSVSEPSQSESLRRRLSRLPGMVSVERPQ